MSDYRQFKDKGATPNTATCECIGRYTGATGAFDRSKYKPCNYAAYGLLHISPMTVLLDNGKTTQSFGFATPDPPPETLQ